MDAHKPGEQKRYPSTHDNDLRYLLYLPPAFNESREKRWPVLCFLHGGGEAATDKAGNDQPIEALMNHASPAWHCEINSPLIRDFIVLSPQLPTRRKWEQPDFEEVEQILRTIYANFRGDPGKTSLTGFSYGAKAVFDFAAWAEEGKDPSKHISWNALWPVDEANDQARASCSVKRVWLHFGIWKPDLQKNTVANLGLAPSEPFRKEYPKTGRLYTEYTSFGYDHVTTCAVSYADWRVYEWLLNSSSGDPTTV
jgi:hypothetical protein